MLSTLIAKTFWLPEQASTFAKSHDGLFYFIYWTMVVFFVAIVGTMTYFAFKYKKRSDSDRTSPLEGNTKIELAWSILPSLLLIVMFAWGFKGYMRTLVPPANATDIHVTGYKWGWNYTYHTGDTGSGELIVPLGQPVRLIMSSEQTSPDDVAVLHSFYVPAFRIKRDVLPFRYTVLWFEATKLGTFDIYCTEYCGTGHSNMIGKIRVVPAEIWEDEISAGGEFVPEEWDSLAAFGENVFNSIGCQGCHSTTGARLVGPAVDGLFGREEQLDGGTAVMVDEDYLRESIMDPQAKIVRGYPGTMPTYAGQLTNDQIMGLVEYIKSLQ